MPSKPQQDKGSFRDSSGFVFYSESIPYRAICSLYRDTYTFFMNSGLYGALVEKGYLIPHRPVSEHQASVFFQEFADSRIFKFIQPDLVPFISYPYEWCFSQLKAAALLTLKIQEEALKHGMVLKDASAYNIQFIGSRAVFIDTLSFEILDVEKPWMAYKQFCQHFIAPLALAKYKNPELQQLSRLYMDGIPLKLTSILLPYSSYFNSALAIHIHLHSKIESRYGGNGFKAENKSKLQTTKKKQLGIVHHLQDGVRSLDLKSSISTWSAYYADNSYSENAFAEKKNLVENWVAEINPATTWDIGCNTGVFSEIAALKSKYTLAFDFDHRSIEDFYKKVQQQESCNLLPLVIDIAHPSPSIGWAGEERKSLAERGPADLILALALIHHLAISHTIPFFKIAGFLSKCTRDLIIEFVPKDDKQTQRLMVTRNDVFDEYHLEGFLNAFSKYFSIVKRNTIADSGRELFWMRNHTV